MNICFSFLRRLRQNTAGTALVEMAILVPILLLLIFGVLEYGRLYWVTGAAQKATAIASRIAAVRPPVCFDMNNWPTNQYVDETTYKAGTLCRASGVCLAPPLAYQDWCALDQDNTATGIEIWESIEGLMPPGSTEANVRLRYTFDERLGFLGGPYTPMVTVELVDLEFRFVSPLGRLAALAASDETIEASHPNSITLSSMSASIPGEDLASGPAN